MAQGNTGTLKTGSDQIFSTALNPDGLNRDAGGLNATGSQITYLGGSLALTDALYNLDYASSAQKLIRDGQNRNTALVMTGKLAEAIQGDISIDKLKDIGVVLADVNVRTDGNLIVGASAQGGSVSHNNDLGVKTLDLGNTGTSVSITGDKKLTLVGDGGELVKTGSTQSDVTIAVGNDAAGASGGTLELGTAAVSSGGTLTGNISVAANGTVNVVSGNFSLDNSHIVSSSGTVNVQTGAVLNAPLALNDQASLNVSGNVQAGSLTAGADTRINVGDHRSAGSISAQNVSLNGGKLFLDPALKESGNSITEASQGAFVFNGEMDGRLAVGQNSIMVLGDTSTKWAVNEFVRSGKKWGPDDVTAALVVSAPVTLSSVGSINVDGSMIGSHVYQNAGDVNFASQSLLMVDARKLRGNSAISGTGSGTVTIADSAALHISNITATKGITILDRFNTVNIAGDGWNKTNLTSADALMKLELEKSGSGTVKVNATLIDPVEALPGVAVPNSIRAIWGSSLNDTESANVGIRFLSRAADDTFVNRVDAVRTINGAVQMTVAAGVQGTTISAAQMPQRAINNHLSLTAQEGQNGTGLHKEGFDVWGEVMYNNTHASGFKAGSLSSGYNTDMGGFVVGGDYTFADNGNGKFRVGGAINLGTGDSSSRGDFNHTRNDFNFWGINLYGGWNAGDINMVADIGYSRSSNELNQTLPSTMQMGQLKADVDSSVLSLGLKGEYRFKTQMLDIVPHIGVRYLNVTTDGFTTKNNDGNLFHTDRDRQNIWQIPVGVTFARDYKADNGWTVKPKLDLSVVPSFGDVDVTTRIRVSGISASDSITSRVMDRTSFDGTFGVDMQKGNMSFGLRYGLQKSSNQTDQAAMATFSYKF